MQRRCTLIEMRVARERPREAGGQRRWLTPTPSARVRPGTAISHEYVSTAYCCHLSRPAPGTAQPPTSTACPWLARARHRRHHWPISKCPSGRWVGQGRLIGEGPPRFQWAPPSQGQCNNPRKWLPCVRRLCGRQGFAERDCGAAASSPEWRLPFFSEFGGAWGGTVVPRLTTHSPVTTGGAPCFRCIPVPSSSLAPLIPHAACAHSRAGPARVCG
jgi:hypothetical protein